jgi:hypothetical protein
MTTQAGDRIGGSGSHTNIDDFERYPLPAKEGGPA